MRLIFTGILLGPARTRASVDAPVDGAVVEARPRRRSGVVGPTATADHASATPAADSHRRADRKGGGGIVTAEQSELPSVPPGTRPRARAARRARRSVAGVAGGVGSATVATAIGAADCGVFVGRPVDVLVCRATGDSLVRAARATQLVLAAGGKQPVLAVNAADASGPGRAVTARLRLLEPHAAAVIVLPYVRRWRELAVPLDEVRGLLTLPRTEVPRSLRRYARAVDDLCAALDHRSTAPTRPPTGRPTPASAPTNVRTP